MTKQKQRFILAGICFSSPGNMGGNTKIGLELARTLSAKMPVVVIVPEACLRTVTDNIPLNENMRVYTVKTYRWGPKFPPFGDALFYYRELKRAFCALQVTSDDIVYSAGDFMCDVPPAFFLKKRFGYTWIPSTFLFIPNPLENLIKRYRFPFFLYTLVYAYQRSLFQLVKGRGDLFVITNACDCRYYPAQWASRTFAFYGGVNCEQIHVVEQETIQQKYAMVFCSRLHPQKGLDQFLDIWQRVIQKVPNAKFAVIGNGSHPYETYLKNKAKRLGIAASMEWFGYVNNEDKYRIYRASKLFVHPTVYDNNGMVAAEALCCGLPVVMNDLPNLRDVYRVGCAKSDFSDQQVTADLISRLLLDEGFYQSIKPTEHDVEALRQHWDWDARCKAFQKFIGVV